MDIYVPLTVEQLLLLFFGQTRCTLYGACQVASNVDLDARVGAFVRWSMKVSRGRASGNGAAGRIMQMMRWGFPPPPNFGNRPVSNVRNVRNRYWRPWLSKPEYRCLVPATSFCEWTDSVPKVTHWFALDDSRPLFAFAGIWRAWTGTRGTKSNPVEGEHLLYSFLTTEANDDVRQIHAKAMPVILTTPEQYDRWLTAGVDVALTLQRPLPGDALQIVARGEKEDG